MEGIWYFTDENNDYLFHLEKPFMEDNKGIRSERVSLEIMESSIPYEYRIVLSADSGWLNDPNTAYPIIIDPTVTHNADANFTGQFNRIADSDTTSSTQLESSYPEATKDPHTVLLLHFNEANGTTAGIRDYASTTRVITANGNASTTSYVTQLGLGNSAAFDGTGDYLTAPDSEDWNFGRGDFTIDGWYRFTSVANSGGIYGQWGVGTRAISSFWSNDNNLYFYYSTDGSNQTELIFAWTPRVNTWYHLAIIRNGNNLKVFVDGTQIGTTKDLTGITIFNSTENVQIAQTTSVAPFNGYLDSLRIIKGRALTPEEIKASASRRPYAVYTSPVVDATASVSWNTVNWTEGGVNTGNGEQPYNTNSLVAQWDFNDTSGTTLTASSSGSCTTACNGTLTNFAYTTSQDQATTTTGWTANNKRWGAGSLMFDGSNDYVSVADSDGWNFGTGNFTIETWINFSVLQNTHFFNQYADGSNYWKIYFNNDTKQLNFGALTGGSGVVDVNAPWSPAVNTWYHIALVRSGSTESVNDWKLFVNGNALTLTKASGLWANSWGDYAGGINIGRWGGGGYLFSGILDSLRIYKGRALSAAEILSNYQAGNIEIQTRTGSTSDPNDGSWEAWKPTTGETQLLSMDSDKSNWNAPEQIDGYTKLLLHMDGTDTATTFPNSATTTHTVTAVNQAQVDTAQSKFSGGSGLFDGVGDYLSVPDSEDWNFGSGDFTIDFWIRPNGTPDNNDILYSQYDNGTNYFLWDWGTSGKLRFEVYGGTFLAGYNMTNVQTWTSGNWYHVALVRYGTSLYMFKDGISQTLTENNAISTDSMPNLSAALWVGRRQDGGYDFTGHIDEFRISKGIARWTSNFTPPPRPYGSNVKASSEDVIKMEGASSTKFMIGAPQIDGNTVGLWHFEETGTTTGTYLYDETANNNDAITTGTTVVDGIFGKGRKFNGTSDYLSVGDTSTFKFLHGAEDTSGFKWSADFWVKMNTFSPAYQAFFGTNSYSSGSVGMLVYINSSRNLGIYMSYGTGGQNIIDATAAGTYPNDTSGWHHIAFTYDQSLANSNFKAYVDGALSGSGSKSVNTPATANSNNALLIGLNVSPGYFLNGNLDEFRILKGRALSPDEIAETYRMGANHHLTRQVSATDLSSANKLTFNIASDRPGNYLEAMLGESDYANYELASSTLALSTTTVLYIKGDEIASSTSLKDSSFSGKAITVNGNARTAGGGKIGNAMYFDGTGDWVDMADSDDWTFGDGEWSIDFWFNTNVSSGGALYMAGQATSDGTESINNSLSNNKIHGSFRNSGGSAKSINGITAISTGVWYHYALIRTGNTLKLFLNGAPEGSVDTTGFTHFNQVAKFAVGRLGEYVTTPWNGYMDEFRILKGTALTADQIRQAYEYGLRAHQITIDFGATLQSSDLISSATDYNFSLTATTSGLSATTSGLYLGDTIIVKENVGGTESVAQGVVKSINSSTGAVTVASWSGSVPSGGFTVNATVFKWQREYFDLSGSLPAHRNAITNITIRPTNGAEGRTVYLDDFRYNTAYLTAPSSSTITSSNNRYLQYRAIFSSWDSFVSPFLSAISVVYSSLATMFAPIISPSGGGFLSF